MRDFRIAASLRLTHRATMRAIKFCVYMEPPFYVAQCLNVDVSSFGETVEEAVGNLKEAVEEAVELHFHDESTDDYCAVEEVLLGEGMVNA